MVTLDQLRAIYPNAPLARLQAALPYLAEVAAKYQINTRLRVAAYLAQVGHESKEFQFSEELASGLAYEGREDLGNTVPGDGPRFKGRGDIQVTGRENYTELSRYLGVDFVRNPALVAQYPYRTLAAGWFWMKNGLNNLADGGYATFTDLTRKINGGTNGLSDRLEYYQRALYALPVTYDSQRPNTDYDKFLTGEKGRFPGLGFTAESFNLNGLLSLFGGSASAGSAYDTSSGVSSSPARPAGGGAENSSGGQNRTILFAGIAALLVVITLSIFSEKW